MKKQELIFVYNANSDLFSTVSDFVHKILSPSTYSCYLCALTYGNFAVKQEWKSFIEGLPIKTVFLYKDKFEKQYRIQPAIPAAFMNSNGTTKEIISKDVIESCQSLEELKRLVKQKIEEHAQHHHSNI
jgi:hypothetical protein